MLKKLIIVGFALALVWLCAWYFLFRNAPLVSARQVIDYSIYPQVLDSIGKERAQLRNTRAGIAAVRKSFLKNMDQRIFTYWYGTQWDFNGTSQKPQEGAIACGYFVTTTLRDAGVKINRVKMAQCASEEMIKSLVGKNNITRFSNIKLTEFEKKMKKLGNGLYIIGLDNHTGFIRISDQGNYFIHASGCYPYKVVKEVVGTSSMLSNSHYKVVGELTDDVDFLQNWVKN